MGKSLTRRKFIIGAGALALVFATNIACFKDDYEESPKLKNHKRNTGRMYEVNYTQESDKEDG